MQICTLIIEAADFIFRKRSGRAPISKEWTAFDKDQLPNTLGNYFFTLKLLRMEPFCRDESLLHLEFKSWLGHTISHGSETTV